MLEMNINKEMERIKQNVIATSKNNNLFEANDVVAVATSGGADSMALLMFLNENKAELGFLDVLAIHVNHGIRGASADRDEQFVVDFCRNNNIARIVYNAKKLGVEIPEHASEEWARNLRYGYFKDASKFYDKLAVAHTVSDQIETVLFRIARGTGMKGLSGIQIKRQNIVRPFLNLTREDTELICEYYGIKYMTDETNLEDTYSRNRIRRYVVPVLRQVNPSGFEKSVQKMCDIANSADGFIRSIAIKILEKAQDKDKRHKFDINVVYTEFKNFLHGEKIGEGNNKILIHYISEELLNRCSTLYGEKLRNHKVLTELTANITHTFRLLERAEEHNEKKNTEILTAILEYTSNVFISISNKYILMYSKNDSLGPKVEIGTTNNIYGYNVEVTKVSLFDFLTKDCYLGITEWMAKMILASDEQDEQDEQLTKLFKVLPLESKRKLAHCAGESAFENSDLSFRYAVSGDEFRPAMRGRYSVVSLLKKQGIALMDTQHVPIIVNKDNKIEWVYGVGFTDGFTPTIKDKSVYVLKSK